MPRSSAKKTTKKVTKKTAKKTTKKAAKTTRKKVTKKTSKKTAKKAVKRTKQAAGGRVLVCASDSQCFWVQDGQVLQDLQDLAHALSTMQEEVFSYHANKERNDFADWVEQVLDDCDCAHGLRKSRSQGGAQRVVIRHLRLYG